MSQTPASNRIPITLSTLGNAGLEESFQYHLARVLENVDDETIDRAAKRKVTIELTFTPHETKNGVVIDCDYKVTAKLATIPVASTVFAFARAGAGFETSEQPPLEQLEIPGARAAKKPTLVTH